MTYFLLALLIALQVLDLWTTSQFKRLGLRERNPLARWLWERWGFISLIVLKLVTTAGIVAVLLLAPPVIELKVAVMLAILALIFVVGNNLQLVLKARRDGDA